MYLFSMLAMPLSFLAILAWTTGGSEAIWRSFARGALFGIPSVVIWLMARPLFTPLWGSPLLVLGFLLRYWILPLGLTTLAYELSTGLSGLARGADYRRFAAFTFGSMTMFGLAQTIQSWGNPSRVYALLVPLLLVSSSMAYPSLVEEAAKDGMPGALKYAALAVAASLLGALAVSLFFMRLEWLGGIVSVLFLAGTGYLGARTLLKGA
ncbi:MAG TPA: hypothetical protein VMX33_01065 [bacterium]|nr:hypothetical protein [bacterium]